MEGGGVCWVKKSECLRFESGRAEWDMKIAPNISIILSGHRSVQSMPARHIPTDRQTHIPAGNRRLWLCPYPASVTPTPATIHAFDSVPSISIYPSICLSIQVPATVWGKCFAVACLAPVLVPVPSPPPLPLSPLRLLTNAHQSAHNGDGIIVFVFSMQSYAKYIHDFHTHTHTQAYIVHNVCVYMYAAITVCVWHTLSLL